MMDSGEQKIGGKLEKGIRVKDIPFYLRGIGERMTGNLREKRGKRLPRPMMESSEALSRSGTAPVKYGRGPGAISGHERLSERQSRWGRDLREI